MCVCSELPNGQHCCELASSAVHVSRHVSHHFVCLLARHQHVRLAVVGCESRPDIWVWSTQSPQSPATARGTDNALRAVWLKWNKKLSWHPRSRSHCWWLCDIERIEPLTKSKVNVKIHMQCCVLIKSKHLLTWMILTVFTLHYIVYSMFWLRISHQTVCIYFEQITWVFLAIHH